MIGGGPHRIALIASSYHPHVGGVEEHVRNVARELRDLGDEVVVWTVDQGEALGTQNVDGTEVRYLPAPLPRLSPTGVAGFLRALPRSWSAWRRAARDFHPDLLHVHCFGPNGVYALALAQRLSLPLVLSSHGETFMDPEVFSGSRLMGWGLRRTLRTAALVTGCSEAVLRDLRGRFGMGPGGVVVPNGVDLDEPQRLGIGEVPPAPATIFAIGRLVRVKGFDLLMRAFAGADLGGVRLVIGGDGPEGPYLASLARTLGVADRVRFLGQLDRAGVITQMAAADAVVVPSRVEAFGIVVLEAWRAGTALVATSRGGPADLVTDGVDGILVDPEDVAALSGALERLLADPALRSRLAIAGTSTVHGYAWKRTAREYREVHDRALGAANG